MKDKYQRGKWINYAVRVLMAAAAPVIAVLGDVTFQDLLSKECGLYKLIKDNRIETIIVLTIIGATATFVYNAIVASREKRVLDEAAESFNEYHMELNNAFFGIRKWYEKNKDQWDKKIEDQITKREAYIDVVQTYSNELCRGINRFFQARYKLDLHVCIKMVDLDSLKESHASKDVGKVRLFTLARGGSNEKERRDMERQQIILRLGDYIQREVTIFPAEPAEKISDFYTMLRANETPWLVDSESAMALFPMIWSATAIGSCASTSSIRTTSPKKNGNCIGVTAPPPASGGRSTAVPHASPFASTKVIWIRRCKIRSPALS